METFSQYLNSPIGVLHVEANDVGLIKVQRVEKALLNNSNEVTKIAINQLTEYFDNTRKSFDLAFDLSSYTEFQQNVWAELLKIPFGQVVNYTDIANALGDAKKVRAVGAANGRNPISIIIPCHRVIGKSGKLIGYSQGLNMKQQLLLHEKAPIQMDLFKS